MIYTLEFENSIGKRREIARFESEPSAAEEHAMEYIHAFCEERGFRIYYVRSIYREDCTWYDVGSHTEFFYLTPAVRPS